MKIKKYLFKISILLTIVLLLSTTTHIVQGYKDSNSKVYTPLEFTADGENGKGNGEISTADAGKVESVGGKIVGIIQIVGTMVAVGMLIVLGIKYMMGSAEERAEYKKTMLPYFVGAVLIFAATSLAQMIYTWASNI